MDNPLISVVILNYNRWDLLEKCARSVLASSYAPFEVIIVDNGSTDKSMSRAQECFMSDGRVRYVSLTPNRHFTGGMNAGIQAARGEWVVLLGNDTLLEPDFLSEVAASLGHDDSIGAATPKIFINNAGRTLDNTGGLLDRFGYGHARGRCEQDNGQYDSNNSFFYASGSGPIYRKSVLEQVGGFDPTFMAHSEDVDLSWRMRLLGKKIVYLPNARMYHEVAATLSRPEIRPELLFHIRKNRIAALIKNYGRLNLLKRMPGVLASNALVFLKELFLDLSLPIALTSIRAVWWNVKELPYLMRERARVQKTIRRVPDRDIVAVMEKGSFFAKTFSGLFSGMGKDASAALAYIVLLGVLTFPWFLHLGSAIPGFSSTDEPYGALWDIWRINRSFWHGQPLSATSLIAFPFGVKLYPYGVGLYLGTFYNHLLSILLPPVLAWNIQILINVFLSAYLTYLLAAYLTKSRKAGFIAGMIFGFCPYQFSRMWQHLGLTFNELIPLALFSAVLLKERPSRKAFLFFICAGILLFSFDYSIAYIGFTGLAVFLLYACLPRPKNDTVFLRNACLAGIITCAALAVQVAPIVKNRILLSGTTAASSFNAFHRPFEDLFEQSARPLSYLLPSASHPVLGGITQSFLGSGLYGKSLTEHNLYVGWAALLLAFYGWRTRKKYVPAGQEGDRRGFYVKFFFILAVTAWLFSQPPYWRAGSLRIPMPSVLMYQFLPMYRAYARFGILLVFALSMLAAFGFSYMTRRKGFFAAALVIPVLVVFEFWNWPPYRVIDVSRSPAVYAWLKDQPGGVIAEYPLDVEAPNELYKFYQIFHGKKITNGGLPGTPSNELARSTALLSDSNTTRILRKMGVTYAVVHHDGYGMSGIASDKEELLAIRLNSDLELVRSFPAEDCGGNGMCVRSIGRVDVYELRDSAAGGSL